MKKPLRVAMVLDAWFPITGGGQIHVARLATVLAQKYPCQIEIITSRLGSDGKEGYLPKPDHNLKITRLGPSFAFENLIGRVFFLILATFRLLTNNYDLIAAHAFLPAIPAKIARLLKKTPVVLTVHGVSVNVWNKMASPMISSLFAWIEQMILFNFKYDYQISVSSDFLKYPNVNKRISVIGNGVDLENFEKVKVKKDKLFKIIFVGRLHQQKGLFYLADAVKILAENYPQIYVSLVGEGPLHQKLKAYLGELKITRKFRFKGILKESALVAEYKSSHLFVLPSLYEGFPLTLLEAWSAKLPVVVTKVGELTHLVKNGTNGFLVEPGNAQALAQAVGGVIKDEKRERLGVAGYNLAKNFDWEKIADQTYSVYRKVLTR